MKVKIAVALFKVPGYETPYPVADLLGQVYGEGSMAEHDWIWLCAPIVEVEVPDDWQERMLPTATAPQAEVSDDF